MAPNQFTVPNTTRVQRAFYKTVFSADLCIERDPDSVSPRVVAPRVGLVESDRSLSCAACHYGFKGNQTRLLCRLHHLYSFPSNQNRSSPTPVGTYIF
jgi:hypothetical protein